MNLGELVAKATVPMRVQPLALARLPYPVSANRYWRSRVFIPKGKTVREAMVQTYVSKEAMDFKEAVGWLVKHHGVREVVKGRVQLDIRLLPHCPKDWKTRAKKDPLYWADTVGRIDLDNARKVVTDALKGVAIEDDFWIWRDYGEVLEPQEGEDASVIVQLSRLVRENPQEALL